MNSFGVEDKAGLILEAADVVVARNNTCVKSVNTFSIGGNICRDMWWEHMVDMAEANSQTCSLWTTLASVAGHFPLQALRWGRGWTFKAILKSKMVRCQRVWPLICFASGRSHNSSSGRRIPNTWGAQMFYYGAVVQQHRRRNYDVEKRAAAQLSAVPPQLLK